MDAQGSLDSVVGRLTTILVDEAQLLGGLRGDVEFIKDEIESMNSLLLYLTEAQHRNHQVRTWMKHVVGLTGDCEGNVELYLRYVAGADPRANKGFLGYLRRFLRLLQTVPARHRIAMRIRELKVRARDVGERRLRYGVTVPSSADQEDPVLLNDVQANAGEDAALRRAIVDGLEDYDVCVRKSVDELVNLLSNEAPAEEPAYGKARLRLFNLVWSDELKKFVGDTISVQDNEGYMWNEKFIHRVAQGLYERKMNSFGCKAVVEVKYPHGFTRHELVRVLQQILQQIAPVAVGQEVELRADQSTETSSDDNDEEAMELTKKLKGHLDGKRFLIFLDILSNPYPYCWEIIRPHLLHAVVDASPGSAIIIITEDLVQNAEYPCRLLQPQSPFHLSCNKGDELYNGHRASSYYLKMGLIHCYPDVFAMKLLLQLHCVTPRMGVRQNRAIANILRDCRLRNKSMSKQMVRLVYNDLPAKYRSCLLYLTIFSQDDNVRRSTVCRRWIVEGLIASRENRTEDETDCCFDALLSWGLIQPGEISDAGKIKTCTLHHSVREVITRIARDVNFVDTDLPPDLARHLSVHSRTGVQASHADCSVEAADSNDIVALLPFLAKSSQWKLLKLLDLEGCKGLKKHHLKSICQILLLKYLSLRNTDVTELPKQIQRLQCLETLDIRQTAVRAFATKSVMLPMLKHLLAGHAQSPSNSSDSSQESFTAVRLPSAISGMEKLETLSHVEVSHKVNDLIDLGHLLQLRKLGVILHGKQGGLGLLFRQIEKLHGCLRSLSIQINQPQKNEDTGHGEEVGALSTPPKFLQSVNISGITSGLPLWIAELDQLTKVTLRETHLGEDYIRILGKLKALRCLRLRRNSCAIGGLGFKEGEFKSLKSLVVNDDIITNITFEAGAAPELEMIVWSFAEMDFLSGVLFLPNLKKLELNGDCDPDPVKRELKEHSNLPDFKHKPRHGHHEDEAGVAATPP